MRPHALRLRISLPSADSAAAAPVYDAGGGQRRARTLVSVALLSSFCVMAPWNGSAPLSAQQWPAAAGSACLRPDVPPGRVVRGSTLDLLTLQPLGGVAVTLRSTVGREIRLLGQTTSDAQGAYVFCGVPDVAGLNVTGELTAITSRSVPIAADSAAPVPPVYIRWSEPADIAGQVLDGSSGAPLEGVTIALEGRPVRAVTDADGQFRILGQGAGRLIVRSSRIGYATRTDSIDVASRDRLDLEIHLFEDAVELPPIIVRARSDLSEQRSAGGTRVDALTRMQIDSLLPQVTDFTSLLDAARFPGLTVRRTGFDLCVEIVRAGPGCNVAMVMVDGVRMLDTAGLVTIRPETVASVQVLDPFEAHTRFGHPGRYGVLLITTR
ncbi:MAG: carboxypeptidase-like regulatory domain-containing protein [Gemmatimonadota bacterium]